jgi:hypothetical protein
MIIDQATLDRIQRPRERTLTLPVRYGKLTRKGSPKAHRTDARGGKALRGCPVRKGGVYHLKAPTPYDRYRAVAERQPTRALMVLRLWDLCDRHRARGLTITVTAVERQAEHWLVHFAPGSHADQFDRPVFLAKYGDYTMTPSKQAVPGDPEVLLPLEADLAKARAKAIERRVSPDRHIVQDAKKQLTPLQQSMVSMKARTRLARVLKELEKIEADLSVEEDGTLPSSDCAVRPVSAAVEGEPRQRGTHALVSLESAA